MPAFLTPSTRASTFPSMLPSISFFSSMVRTRSCLLVRASASSERLDEKVLLLIVSRIRDTEGVVGMSVSVIPRPGRNPPGFLGLSGS